MSQIEVTQENLKNLMDMQYSFHAFKSKLEHMSPAVQKEFDDLAAAVRTLFQEQNDKEAKEHTANYEMFDELQTKHNLNAVWSMYEIGDINATFGQVSVLKYLDVSEAVGREVTYLELWQIADRLMKASGDSHHVFIEGFAPRGENVFELVTGS